MDIYLYLIHIIIYREKLSEKHEFFLRENRRLQV